MFAENRLSIDDTNTVFDPPERPRSASPTRRILVVLHQEHSHAGRIGRLLCQHGYRLDCRRPRFGDPLPRTMDEHDGAIVFGGPMSANDDEAWIHREIDWVGVPLAASKPFLGICLGAQMLARHLGERVAPHPQGLVEVGYYPIRTTAEGRAAWPLFPQAVYQWHREGFDLPCGATLLAEGDAFPAQAFRFGDTAYGLQFHPETTYQTICRWTTRSSLRTTMPGARPRERHFLEWHYYDGAVSRWLDGFLRQWVRGARTMPAMRGPTMRGPTMADPLHA